MKLTRTTLAFVALNLAWLAVLSVFVARRGGRAAGDVQYVTNYVPVLKAKAAGQALMTNVVVATNDFRWSQLEAEDYRDYIARLRAVGCPEQTIRDIIIADVDKLLAPRLLAASGRTNPLSFWRPIEQELWEDAEQKEALRQQRTVDFQKREVIRELLGVDLVGERLRLQGQGDYYGDRLNFLPEEKRARVRLALDRFADEERELLEEQAENGGDPAALAKLRQEKEAALGQLLTPEEREHYDLWFSPVAAAVRDSVFGMNASQEEFMTLYQLRRAFAAQHGEAFGPGHSAWSEYESRLRQQLGDKRFAEYARAQDQDYRELLRVTSRHKLSPDVATQLYDLKGPIAEARAQVEADPSLTPQQKSAAMDAIATETQKAFREVLGEKAFRHLMQRSANPWLRGAPPANVATAP
jgi:hypothetical protein